MRTLVTVIIPNYNEEANLKRGVLDAIHTYLSKQNYGYEVIISDDGSTDRSLEIVHDFTRIHKEFRLLKNKHAGKPFAIKSAIKIATGKYVLFTDMDQSTPMAELSKLLPWADKGFKVVIGSRGTKRADASLFRQFASIVFFLIRRAIILPRIKDTQCGFKLMERDLAEQIFGEMRIFGRDNKARGWKVTAYDVEMLYLARKKQIPIQEVQVTWRDEDTSVNKNRGKNFVKESIEMFFEVLRVRVNDILGKYD